jgi:hypothetical protein
MLPRRSGAAWTPELGHFLLVMLLLRAACLATFFGLLYQQQVRDMDVLELTSTGGAAEMLKHAFVKVYAGLLLVIGIVAWWLVLAHKSRQVAQEESNRQSHLLMREIDRTADRRGKLQQAKQQARRAGQPGQEPLHQRHQPRTAHAA